MATKTWFITGTSSGFGRQLTQLLLERGDRVAATLRKPEAIKDLADQYGAQLWVRALDVTDTAQVREVVAAAFTDLGRIDAIVSNAGYGLFGAAEELSDEQISRQIDTNLVGSIQLARAVIPHLRAHGGGRIVQLSSMGGQIAFPGASLYHATKWGIEGFFESVIPEIAAFGIEVTLVEPGGARTQFAGTSLAVAPPSDAYTEGVVGQMRQFMTLAGVTAWPGDPIKIAQAIIDSTDQTPAPKRLLLGSDAYANVHAALTERLAAVESQQELAFSSDADDVIAARA
ncbi:short-chain dehydrogenase/reductase [Acrocarpospora corrugata]|uniref:Short-chain dehydrogenase/reductase n=1 Tax=Acrocarpospora corrugata TaxID=35763 RepID=A0A5M3WDQ9_9ACTN|nr:SDR family oxidoreductase [Acrocarpospora corrugata]GES05233.1 short-chain dehydrogenase/reductase [Acrocarpospora corrugata]